VKATEVTAGLAESNGSLLLGLMRDSLPVHWYQLRAQCWVTSMGKLYLTFYQLDRLWAKFWKVRMIRISAVWRDCALYRVP